MSQLWASTDQARTFRTTRRSQLRTYGCQLCQSAYKLHTGTVFQQYHLNPSQVVLLMRGICKGESSNMLAQELQLNYKTVLELRHRIQDKAEREQPNTPLTDSETEPDEMFQNGGEKVSFIPMRMIPLVVEPTPH